MHREKKLIHYRSLISFHFRAFAFFVSFSPLSTAIAIKKVTEIVSFLLQIILGVPYLSALFKHDRDSSAQFLKTTHTEPIIIRPLVVTNTPLYAPLRHPCNYDLTITPKIPPHYLPNIPRISIHHRRRCFFFVFWTTLCLGQ